MDNNTSFYDGLVPFYHLIYGDLAHASTSRARPRRRCLREAGFAHVARRDDVLFQPVLVGSAP